MIVRLGDFNPVTTLLKTLRLSIIVEPDKVPSTVVFVVLTLDTSQQTVVFVDDTQLFKLKCWKPEVNVLGKHQNLLEIYFLKHFEELLSIALTELSGPLEKLK